MARTLSHMRVYGCVCARHDGLGAHRFDVVMFNHPHAGVEDFIRHRVLMAHFMYSAASERVLRPGGEVHVVLANRQPENWQLLPQAARVGMACVQRCAWRDTDFPGYVRRRHQGGGSFARTRPRGNR